MPNKNIIIRLTLCFLLITLTCTAAAGFDFSEIESKINEFTLDNGMKFIVMEDHTVPIVSFSLLVDVGSADDPKGYTGLAHIFEHMAFKGTSELGTVDYKKERQLLEALDQAYAAWREEKLKGIQTDPEKTEQLREAFEKARDEAEQYVKANEFVTFAKQEGANFINAGTSYDHTRYVFAFPSNKLELWFALESSRFTDPVLRQFYTELGPIEEERRGSIENSPIGRLVEEFFAAAYMAHPYGIRILGHMSDIKNTNREQAIDYFRTYYVASNITAAIVGDVDPQKVRTYAEKYFGKLPSVPKPEPITTVEPKQRAERRVILYDKSQPLLLIGYHRPAATHPDDAVFDALADYIGQGRTSLLYKKLVKEKKMAAVTQAYAGFPAVEYPCLFGIGVMPTKDYSAVECEAEVAAVIEEIKKEKITEEELTKIKARAMAGLVNTLDNYIGFTAMPSLLAMTQNTYGDWRELFRGIERIEAVTAEDVQRVANEYLIRENMTVAYIETVED